MEPVLSLEPSFMAEALLDRAKGVCGASAVLVLSSRYKLLKILEKNPCHLYFTDYTLAVQPEPLGWRNGRRQRLALPGMAQHRWLANDISPITI